MVVDAVVGVDELRSEGDCENDERALACHALKRVNVVVLRVRQEAGARWGCGNYGSKGQEHVIVKGEEGGGAGGFVAERIQCAANGTTLGRRRHGSNAGIDYGRAGVVDEHELPRTSFYGRACIRGCLAHRRERHVLQPSFQSLEASGNGGRVDGKPKVHLYGESHAFALLQRWNGPHVLVQRHPHLRDGRCSLGELQRREQPLERVERHVDVRWPSS